MTACDGYFPVPTISRDSNRAAGNDEGIGHSTSKIARTPLFSDLQARGPTAAPRARAAERRGVSTCLLRALQLFSVASRVRALCPYPPTRTGNPAAVHAQAPRPGMLANGSGPRQAPRWRRCRRRRRRRRAGRRDARWQPAALIAGPAAECGKGIWRDARATGRGCRRRRRRRCRRGRRGWRRRRDAGRQPAALIARAAAERGERIRRRARAGGGGRVGVGVGVGGVVGGVGGLIPGGSQPP